MISQRKNQPKLMLFDVNETLSDMSPLRDCFETVGASGDLVASWFAGVLRDGFALTIAGGTATFADIAEHGLLLTFSKLQLTCTSEEAVSLVMNAFADLRPHPDVAPGLRRLRAGGARIVTLSNGPSVVAENLLMRAGLASEVERFLSVENVSPWKPAAAAYKHALATCGVAAARAMLVAVHPWDIDGAMRAGLQTAWINRNDETYPDYFRPPTVHAKSIDNLVQQLAATF